MTQRKARKLSGLVVEELQRRSKKGLEFAKKSMLTERIENEKLRKALEHYLSNWNDFTHAGLFSIACEAVGGNPDNAVNIQAAISILAAAFDIHDDIIDESGQKHGIPTVFGKYGSTIALLLGDAFLIKGFTLFYDSIQRSARGKTLEIVEALQRSLFELGNAHALELNLRGRTDANPEEYIRIIEMKAASVESDMQIGAFVGKGSNKEIASLAKYGRILGTLATLREEFIDIFEIDELNQRIIGKALPVPVLLAFQDPQSKLEAEELVSKEISGKNAEKLLDVILKSRSVLDLRNRMMSLSAQAIKLSSNVPNERIRSMLQILAESALEDL